MKLGRFVIDSHVHAQRFAAGPALAAAAGEEAERNPWEQLSHTMGGLTPYDNSERLIYDMDCYGVDRCVLLPAFGMTNELNAEIVARHPDRFVAVCNAQAYLRRVAEGEEEWSIAGVCAELDRLLCTGNYAGIGRRRRRCPIRRAPTGW